MQHDEPKGRKWLTRWKVVVIHRDPIRVQAICLQGRFAVGEELTSSLGLIGFSHEGVAYPAGFHVFTRREDADWYRSNDPTGKIVRVQVRGLVAKGAQGPVDVEVYRYMIVSKSEVERAS